MSVVYRSCAVQALSTKRMSVSSTICLFDDLRTLLDLDGDRKQVFLDFNFRGATVRRD